MARRLHTRHRAEGFTLIEVVVALAVLGASLFVLLQAHFASLNLYLDAEEQALADLFTAQAVGIAEFEILSGEESGEGDFGERFEGYAYSYSTEQRDPEAAPGLFDVTVSIAGPEETRTIMFVVYDGVQIELE